jgi:hypothetical protein
LSGTDLQIESLKLEIEAYYAKKESIGGILTAHAVVKKPTQKVGLLFTLL